MNKIYKKSIAALSATAALIFGMIMSASAAVSAAFPDVQKTLASYYKTNPSGTGIKATISVDGDISDWSSDALIAQGAANDLPYVYQNNTYTGSRPDLYSLYGAYDSKNLYLMWEMTDVRDVTSPGGNSDDFGDAYGVDENPFFIAIGTSRADVIGNQGKTSTGNTLQNKGISFDGSFNRVIALTASGEPQIAVYMGNENGINPLTMYSSENSGICIYGGSGILSSQVYGINGDSGRTLYDICNNNASWIDYCKQGHDSGCMDRHYEMSVPLSVLGVTEEQVDKHGLTVCLMSTAGGSGVDCLPYDTAMQDNAAKGEEDTDQDLITSEFARIGGTDVIDNTSSLSSYIISRGDSVKVRPSAANGKGSVSFDVFYKKTSSSKWSKMAENTTAKAIKLIPSVATDYIIRVDAKDKSGNITKTELPLKVVEPLNNISYLSTDCISYGDIIKAFCRSEGGSGNIQYAVYYKRSSKTDWMRVKDYSTSDTVFIRPKVAAAYEIKIKAKDEKGTVSEKVLELRVKTASDLINRTELSAAGVTAGEKVMISTASTGGRGETQFAAYYKSESSEVWNRISGYTDADILSFKPAKTGEYIVRTKVRDTSGRIVNKDIPLTVTAKVQEPVFTQGETDDTFDSVMIKTREDYIAMQQKSDPAYTALPELPKKVDNSDNEYFPPIVCQVGGTCCIHGTTYYQYTYEYNRLHNIVTNPSNCFSPAYTYNLATNKKARGMLQENAFFHLKAGGAVTSELVPFGKDELDSNPDNYYYDLPLDEEIYRFAADHRIRNYYEFSKIGDDNTLITSVDDTDLIPIKTALADGHVLTIYIFDNWRFKRLKATDNPAINNGVVGQNCIYYSFSETGDHIVTVVGYDDNIWTDINENGEIDKGEMGALKIANSWGEEWGSGNKGYVWMAYDALNYYSCVSGFKFIKQDQDKLDTPNNTEWRMNGAYHISGIQLYPENYQSTVYMHYVVNTNDRVNSYANLIGEYKGKTVSECMDPYNHTRGPFSAFAYNLSNPGGYAHFVYDVSPIMRKLGAADYTKVKWTVKFETKSDSAVLNVSDVYMCDEKNFRLYRTEGKFPIKISGADSRSLALSDNYTRYAKVNYRGLNGNVVMGCYPQGDQNYEYLADVNMKQVSTVEGYTHTAIVDLNGYDYYNVFFYNNTGSDENGQKDYRIYPGENNFETSEVITPLKITVNNQRGTDYSPGSSLRISASAVGGTGSCCFRYSVTDTKTGTVVFDGNYGYRTNNSVLITDDKYSGKNSVYTFEKTGDYKVNVYACDITGNTVSSSFTAKVRNFEFKSFVTSDGGTVYNKGDNVSFNIETINDDLMGYYSLVVLQDNNISYQNIYSLDDDNFSFDSVDLDEKNHTISATAIVPFKNSGTFHVIIRRSDISQPVYSDMILTVK